MGKKNKNIPRFNWMGHQFPLTLKEIRKKKDFFLEIGLLFVVHLGRRIFLLLKHLLLRIWKIILIWINQSDSRKNYIESQLKSRYSKNSCAPFQVFKETLNENVLTIGNLHPLSVSKSILSKFNDLKIYRIKKLDLFLLYLKIIKILDS